MSSRDTRSASAPLLLLMKGHPGSGKSTLARLIASNFGITISDKDDSKDCFQAAEKQFGSAGAWDLNALSYQVMFRVASSQLDCGQSVVVDCPLSKLELYQQANGIAEQVSSEIFSIIPTLLIVCTTSSCILAGPGLSVCRWSSCSVQFCNLPLLYYHADHG